MAGETEYRGVAWFRTTLAAWIFRIHFRVLGLLLPRRPLPLGYWSAWRWIARAVSGTPTPSTPVRGAFARVVRRRTGLLWSLLEGQTLGHWTIDEDSLALLWRTLHRVRPGCVVECGCGVSTVMLAAYARERADESGAPCRVFSLEQNDSFRTETIKRLAACGLDGYATVLFSPLDEREVYTIAVLREALGDLRPDLILIDGPSGSDDCRLLTLPSLAPLCADGARWYMDDALRDAEMSVLRRWSADPALGVAGIIAVGKGLGCGRLRAGSAGRTEPKGRSER